MTTTSEPITTTALELDLPQPIFRRHPIAHRRLDQTLAAARRVRFDDDARLVFFSDCHRGDKGPGDVFAVNEDLFCHALSHYAREAFTYVEVGDGDELWRNHSFADVRRAHRRTYDLLHRFHRQGRLHMLLGNHDVQGRRARGVEKDGIPADEAILFEHAGTGQQLFVLHGHQASFASDGMSAISRFAVRHIWARLRTARLDAAIAWKDKGQKMGLGERWVQAFAHRCADNIKARVVSWLEQRQQIVICGHTHHAACPAAGAAPYFNTGNCLAPGTLTGLEIVHGRITPVRWRARLDQPGGALLGVSREPTGLPRSLASLG
jgi:UDP-2,3-diacylglucosamine pyrophosphatase LpxH